MSFKVIGQSALSGALLLAAVSGQVNPKIIMEDGSILRSWPAADLSSLEVRAVESGSGGWLKLLLGMAGGAFCCLSIRSSYEAEEDAELDAQDRVHRLQKYQLQQSFALQAQEAASVKQLAVVGDVEQIKAEQEAEMALADYLGVETAAIAPGNSNQPQEVVVPVAQRPSSQAASVPVVMPKTNFIETAPSPESRNIPKEFAANPKTALIIGVPGAGKGMFVANAVRDIRLNRPAIKIFGIDPKGDPKEKGYWAEGYDEVYRTQGGEMNDEAFVNWLKNSIEEFKKHDGEKLLILDEVTSSFNRWGSVDNKSYASFTNYLVHIASAGDSLGQYVWAIGQIANAKDMNMSGGIRSLFKPIAIVSNSDRRASDQLLGTNFVPKPADGRDEVYEMCDQSKVGRAIYDYMSDQWCPMPVLENYSGFNRDTREFDDPAKKEESPKPSADEVINAYRELGSLASVISTLWGTHPEDDKWDAAKRECRELLGLD